MKTEDQNTNALLSAILLQAMRDVAEKDFYTAQDAYLWLCSDGPFYTEALGMEVDIVKWAMEKWQLRETSGALASRLDMKATFIAAKQRMKESA
jgi:hypothetical protein